MEIKAHSYPNIYKNLGINLSTLKAVMAKVEFQNEDLNINLTHFAAEYYKSNNPDRFWINGNVLNDAHVTLSYGILPEFYDEDMVKEVLQGCPLKIVKGEEIGFFSSPYPDEKYDCLHIKLKVSEELLDARNRLALLPNIQTFPAYKPHITIAYLKELDEESKIYIMNELWERFVGREFKVTY